MIHSECPYCENGVITLRANLVPVYSTLDDEPTMPAYAKQHHCPECQPVFYLHDLEQVSCGERYPKRFSKEAGYMETLRRRIAAILGRLAFEQCVVQREDPKLDMSYGEEMVPIYSHMHVVKKDAPGWLNYRRPG